MPIFGRFWIDLLNVPMLCCNTATMSKRLLQVINASWWLVM